MPTTYVAKRLNPNRNDNFHLCDNLTFTCSPQLREFLQDAAKAQEAAQAAEAIANKLRPMKFGMSKMCRIALQEFLHSNKPQQTRHIGPRLLGHTPLPQTSTISLSLPSDRAPINSKTPHNPDAGVAYDLRHKLFEYAKDNNITISTVLRRAAYTYALKIKRTTDADYEEDPLLVLDAWLNVDKRGRMKKAPTQPYIDPNAPTTPRPITAEDIAKITAPLMHQVQVFQDPEQKEFEEILKNKDALKLKPLPPKKTKKKRVATNAHDDWVTDSEW